MKKLVLIDEEVLVRLIEGKHVEGSLFRDKWTGIITFNAYKRLAKKRVKEVLIKKTPWGWVKASVARKKRFTSVPNDITLEEQLEIMDQENKLAKQALIENYIIESV
jgi:hypothetical protein